MSRGRSVVAVVVAVVVVVFAVVVSLLLATLFKAPNNPSPERPFVASAELAMRGAARWRHGRGWRPRAIGGGRS